MNWKLKDILFMAIAAVVFGAVYLGAVYAGGAFTAALTPIGYGTLGYEPLYGVFFMAAVFVSYIVRKPGIGVIAELLAAIIEVLMGNYFGPGVIINGLLQGAACELPFLLTRYKKWNLKTTVASSVCVAVIVYLYDFVHDSYYLMGTKLIAMGVVIRIVSSIVFTGVIAKLLADALNKAGVLRGYQISGNLGDLYEE